MLDTGRRTAAPQVGARLRGASSGRRRIVRTLLWLFSHTGVMATSPSSCHYCWPRSVSSPTRRMRGFSSSTMIRRRVRPRSWPRSPQLLNQMNPPSLPSPLRPPGLWPQKSRRNQRSRRNPRNRRPTPPSGGPMRTVVLTESGAVSGAVSGMFMSRCPALSPVVIVHCRSVPARICWSSSMTMNCRVRAGCALW